MSRIGKIPVKLPQGVNVKNEGGRVVITGPLGSLELKLNEAVRINTGGNEIRVEVEDKEKKNLFGLSRSLIANMVTGVTQGWTKVLELTGTGYRATTTGNDLQLALGFSHPVKITAPMGIRFEVKENKITISGTDKMLVGETAAKIRALKPADPYKAKGFKYENEIIIRKAGKAAKAAA